MTQRMSPNLDARGTIYMKIKNGPSGGYKNPVEKLAAKSTMFNYCITFSDYMAINFCDIKYSGVQVAKSVESLDTLQWANHTEQTDEQVISRTYQNTDSFAFSYTKGFKIGTTTKVSISLPLEVVKLGVETSISTELNFQSQKTVTVQKSRTFNTTSHIKIPAHTALNANLSLEKCTFYGAYEAKYKPVFTNKGRHEWDSEIDWFKDHGHPEMEELRGKEIIEIFPDLDLLVDSSGNIDGAAGYAIKIETKSNPV